MGTPQMLVKRQLQFSLCALDSSEFVGWPAVSGFCCHFVLVDDVTICSQVVRKLSYYTQMSDDQLHELF